MKLARSLHASQPWHTILHPQLCPKFHIPNFHPPFTSIQRPRLHNRNALECLPIHILINLRSTVLAEMERQGHATGVGRRVASQMFLAGSDG